MKQHMHIAKATANTLSMDFSHLLDAPAGKHGFVTTKNGHFYFEDGTRAKFMGFCIAARSNTPDHKTAERLAERFASMGVNVIRLHAADAPILDEECSWSSCRESPLIDYEKGSSLNFNSEGLDRYDYLFAKLKEKGIYLHVDLCVARSFVAGDGLDYPGDPGSCLKVYTLFNARLMELDKEYAYKLLTHINPYTGLSILDDPAVMTIQMTNEQSALKGTDEWDARLDMEGYRNEVKSRYNHFLLAKYGTRDNLKAAWTFEGKCALHDDEDPLSGTVRGFQGGFYQVPNDPMGDWEGDVPPPRYADYTEFLTKINRDYYQGFYDYLRSLGVRVPISTSNLMAGAADIYGHTGADVMENDCYFNHPVLPVTGAYQVMGPFEYASISPFTVQRGAGTISNTIVSMAALSATEGRAQTLAEWNEYGLYPFHSTAYIHTVSYACLNDWDALILYNYHTSHKTDDQEDDEIQSIFDCYNDPSLICQWGMLSEIFLKELVSPANATCNIVYTKNELDTLPNYGHAPYFYFPYVMRSRNVFLENGDKYKGNADTAINAGFLNCADLSEAKHGIYYAWSPYRDAFRKYKDEKRLALASKGCKEVSKGVKLGEKNLVFDDIAALNGKGDYTEFAGEVDAALKSWGVIGENTGLVGDKIISDTGELVMEPTRPMFTVNTAKAVYFSGAPRGKIKLGKKVCVRAKNGRITLGLLAKDSKTLQEASEALLFAIGESGMDQSTYSEGVELVPGVRLTAVDFKGKLYAETLEGEVTVDSSHAALWATDPVGNVIAEIKGEVADGKTRFKMTGEYAAVNFRLTM